MKRRRGSELNPKEKRVLRVFPAEPASISQLARKAWPGKGWTSKSRGNWTLRNCLRKLTKQGLVRKVGRGLYATVPR